MRILTLASTMLFLVACGGDREPSRNFANICANPRANDIQGTVIDENNWIRSWSHETYLWYDELPEIHPAAESDPIAYFDRMKTNAITASGRPKDRFHYTEKTVNSKSDSEGRIYLKNTEKYRRYSGMGYSTGYGLKVLVTRSTPPRQLLVAHTEPESPAALKQIVRGNEITAINEYDIKNGSTEDYYLALSALFPEQTGEYHKFVIQDVDNNYKRSVIMESAEVAESPVIRKIIRKNNKKIGYLALNTFGIDSVEKILVDTINIFLEREQQTTEAPSNENDGADGENPSPEVATDENEYLDELVLDLRYNGGGYLDISAELATMIVGNNGTGKLYGEIIHNDKRTFRNVWYPFPTIASGFSAAAGSILPTLNLSRVYILSSGNTASASEFLINGLRGIDIEVILIGDTTTGKPYGFVPRDNCGTTYFTIQFKGYNSKGFGDYADGLIPSATDFGPQVRGCKVMDDLSKPLGDPSEMMLATALHYIENQSCPAATQAIEGERNSLSEIRGKLLSPYPAEMILR